MKLTDENKKRLLEIAEEFSKLADKFVAIDEIDHGLNSPDARYLLDDLYDVMIGSSQGILTLVGMNDDEIDKWIEEH